MLEPLYRGENALEPERVSEKLHQNTFWLGRGGSLTHTISGIDIALWDILGKATGQPVGRLLGGRYRERVRPYASLLMDAAGAAGASSSRQIAARGFRAFKIGWGPFGRVSHALDEAIVRAARDAVGADAQLMVDAGGSDAFWPQRATSGRCAPPRCSPTTTSPGSRSRCKPDALDDYRRRCAGQRRVPIAGGEVLTRRQAFAPWLEARRLRHRAARRDQGRRHLARSGASRWMAQEHGVRFIPHGWNTAVGLAADLHLASAFPDTDLVEYIDGSPYVDEIVAEPWRLDADGMLAIPDGPGLGVRSIRTRSPASRAGNGYSNHKLATPGVSSRRRGISSACVRTRRTEIPSA